MIAVCPSAEANPSQTKCKTGFEHAREASEATLSLSLRATTSDPLSLAASICRHPHRTAALRNRLGVGGAKNCAKSNSQPIKAPHDIL